MVIRPKSLAESDISVFISVIRNKVYRSPFSHLVANAPPGIFLAVVPKRTVNRLEEVYDVLHGEEE